MQSTGLSPKTFRAAITATANSCKVDAVACGATHWCRASCLQHYAGKIELVPTSNFMLMW